MKNFPLSQQLSWINQTVESNPHSNLAGFAIWAYDYWDNSGGTSNDFAAWASWVTKGSVPSSNTMPSVTVIIIVVIAATGSAITGLIFKNKTKKQNASQDSPVSPRPCIKN
jgi:hypothetical protein